MDLNCINTELKSGNEKLIFNGKNIDFSLLDFWKWSVSDILSNATRGKLAEFIVATALDIDLKIPRNEWQAYDLITKNKIKLEIKSSAYLQSWFQKKYSNIIFSIKESKEWDSKTNMLSKESKRQADVYVFCFLNHKDKKTVNPLDLNQWEFYILSTKEVNNYKRSKLSINLESLKKLTNPIDYENIKNEIDKKALI
ncbi:MAG: hypothetical protein PHN56_03940 [Candidatus Nanoarchaeia archaeon]|nr:hypothetical protein [Candidatus Nanoarchaeia archaeon]